MTQKITPKIAGKKFTKSLPNTRNVYDLQLPVNLSFEGSIEAEFERVPPEEFFVCLRNWLYQQKQKKVYYFLAESVKGEETDFEFDVEDLSRGTLTKINVGLGYTNYIVGYDFSWVIFIDEEGTLYVAGSSDLLSVVNKCVKNIN